MNENLFEAQYDVSKKNRLKRFYTENKIAIFSTIIVLLILAISFSIYLINKEKKDALLADNYIEAKIYLEAGEKNKAKRILKNIVLSNNGTYSALSLFLILNENLIVNEDELLNLFNLLLKSNKFENEIKNLIIFKKAIFQSNYSNELELIETTDSSENSIYSYLFKPKTTLGKILHSSSITVGPCITTLEPIDTPSLITTSLPITVFEPIVTFAPMEAFV